MYFTNLIDCRLTCKHPYQGSITALDINNQIASSLALSGVKYDLNLFRYVP